MQSIPAAIADFNPLAESSIIIHSLGTIGAFCFIASLHTKSVSFRAILRRLSTYVNVFVCWKFEFCF